MKLNLNIGYILKIYMYILLNCSLSRLRDQLLIKDRSYWQTQMYLVEPVLLQEHVQQVYSWNSSDTVFMSNTYILKKIVCYKFHFRYFPNHLSIRTWFTCYLWSERCKSIACSKIVSSWWLLTMDLGMIIFYRTDI